MRFLKTNTATRVTVGPFVDATDGKTPETAITVTGCHLTLVVDDGGVPTLALDADATASAGNNDMVHVTNDDAGFYDLELTAAQLNYVGRAILAIVNTAVHLPVFHEFMILPANIYDSFIGGTDTLQADVTQISGSAVSTSTAQLGVNAVQAGGTAWASGAITAASLAADAITAAKVAADVSAEIADAVWDEAATGHTDAGKAGEQLWTDVDAILVDTGTTLQAEVDGIQTDTEDIQSRLPAALVSGRIDASVGAMAAGVVTASAIATGAIDADALAADAVDEILDEVIEGTVTMRQAIRVFLAALAGKLSGAGTTTVTIRDTTDATDRIVATVDSSGNRTAVTLTLT